MRLSTVSFFVDKDRNIKADIISDKDDNFWPITLRISAKDEFPYISIFMHHAELMSFIASLQTSLEEYSAQYDKEPSNG
jgi:hypothetical protein